LRSRIDLYLLRDAINQLAETTYFTSRLHEFTEKIVQVIDYVLTNEATIAPEIVNKFRNIMHQTYVYLAGSTTKEAPYEMEYCLHKALARWVTRETIITTALTSHHDFHFAPADPWDFVKRYLPGFDTAGYDPLLVQLGLPRLYRHKPVYCLALYHELGHFVDESFGITDLSLVLDPSMLATQHLAIPAGASVQLRNRIESHHRKEYFCDLFGAAYAGQASIEALTTIAPGALASQTHPATADRETSVGNFLGGRPSPLIDLFQRCLVQQGKPRLDQFFRPPTLRPTFDDLRPYQIADEQELHGVLGAAWSYLLGSLDQRAAPWIGTDMADSAIERIVNDLTEKTLRNASIRERWSSHGTAP
jgi:hypothetical protein